MREYENVFEGATYIEVSRDKPGSVFQTGETALIRFGNRNNVSEKMNIIDPETDPQKTELYNEPSIFPLFPTPVVKININRDFTKEELQFFLTKPPMWKDPKIGMSNHRSIYLIMKS